MKRPGISPSASATTSTSAAFPRPDPSKASAGISGTSAEASAFRGKRRLYEAFLKQFPSRHWRNSNREESLRKIAAGDYDLFHPTYYDPYFLEAIGSKPFVLTIHDMIPELYCEYYPLDDPTAAWKRLLIGRAAGIIAVSENTKKDLVDILGVPPEKVAVVHHGTTYAAPEDPTAGRPPATGPAPAGLGLPDRYLLYIGTRERYKNLYFFLLALAGVFAQERTSTWSAPDSRSRQKRWSSSAR